MIYNYPKSSCNCNVNTPDSSKQNDMHVNINISAPNCDANAFNCTDRYMFYQGTEPQDKQGYNTINPNHIPFSKCYYKKDGDNTYVSGDPRLYDSVRSHMLELDRPPHSGHVQMREVYNEKGYRTGNNAYENLKGQIQYYTSKSIEDPYFSPNFKIPSKVTGIAYKDPMGVIEPHYHREPLTEKNSCLSWISDSMEHREGLMASQMELYNKNRWMSRNRQEFK